MVESSTSWLIESISSSASMTASAFSRSASSSAAEARSIIEATSRLMATSSSVTESRASWYVSRMDGTLRRDRSPTLPSGERPAHTG